MKKILTYLKQRNYPYTKAIGWITLMVGLFGIYFLPSSASVITIPMSVLGAIYYVLSEHNKIERGDELEKKIYLETLSYSLNSIMVVGWGLFLISAKIYYLGETYYTLLFIIYLLGILPLSKYLVRKKHI